MASAESLQAVPQNESVSRTPLDPACIRSDSLRARRSWTRTCGSSQAARCVEKARSVFMTAERSRKGNCARCRRSRPARHRDGSQRRSHRVSGAREPQDARPRCHEARVEDRGRGSRLLRSPTQRPHLERGLRDARLGGGDDGRRAARSIRHQSLRSGRGRTSVPTCAAQLWAAWMDGHHLIHGRVDLGPGILVLCVKRPGPT